MAAATGGTYDPQAADVFAADDRTVPASSSPWSLLVAAALVLFVIDVGLRRLRV